MRSFPADGLSEAKAAVIQMFWKTDNPIHIGTVAVNLKWPLAWAEQLLDLMVAEGSVRLCTTAENRAFGITHGFLPPKGKLDPVEEVVVPPGVLFYPSDVQLVNLAHISDLALGLGGDFIRPGTDAEVQVCTERGARLRFWMLRNCLP